MRRSKRPESPAGESRESGVSDILQDLLARESEFRAFVRRRVPDPAIADDLLQQSFLRAVEQQHHIERRESVVAWFYRILRNAVVDYYRSHAADSKKAEAFRQELVGSGDDQTPALDEWRPTLCACLERLLPHIRPAYADLLRRIDLQGESPALVAKDLGITPNNLTVRLHRARQALRTSLEQVCGMCTKHGCLNCTCA